MIFTKLYFRILSKIIKQTFDIWQRLGFHITVNHFYEPIPDTGKLTDAVWSRESPMKGIELHVDKQLVFLDTVCSRFKHEYDSFGLNSPESDCSYYSQNGAFGEIDGDILYSMIREHRPKKIIEIGSGWSTQLAGYALERNRIEYGISGQIYAIEPYPNKILKAGFPGLTQLIEKTVQEVDLTVFEALEENDILFIDSSHIVKTDSDVCYEFLEILPCLKKGVLVHIHDIFLPREYPKNWVVNQKLFFNEGYLLQAFLMFNHAFEVIWAGNYIKLKYPEKCAQLFRTQASQSFWIRKIE
ncbi:MAG: class I SAM-dependent methyltransferase [Bacteriovoracaceae bacterium]